jgi:salicylate hydroxylase
MAREPIAIVGGGIGGLAAALALLRRGIDVDVYEQAPELRELGAGVQISANGTRVLFALGLEPELQRVQVIPDGKEVRLWNTGQTWKLFDLGVHSVERYGFPYITIHRGDLHDAIAAGVRREKSDAIHLGRKCIGISQTEDAVEILFESADPVRAKLVVGADGVHSVVRGSLFGADAPEFMHLVAWRGVVPMDRVPPSISRTVGTNWIGPGGHVVHYPLRAGKLLNFVGHVERSDWTVESWTMRGTTEELANDYRGWHPDIQAMIRNIETPYKFAVKSRPPMPAWSKIRCTLLGDACHSMVPFLAQGAVMALEDGFILARCLEKYAGDHATAFARYEAVRRERANKCVLGSTETGRRFHDQQMADTSQAEAYVAREWHEDKIRQRYEWLFVYDATSVPI